MATLCSSLDPAHQSSLLAFAQFLKSQEAQTALEAVDEEDEAAWERDFNDPAKVANFARWADESLAREKPQRIDPARLCSRQATGSFGGSITCCRNRPAPSRAKPTGCSCPTPTIPASGSKSSAAPAILGPSALVVVTGPCAGATGNASSGCGSAHGRISGGCFSCVERLDGLMVHRHELTEPELTCIPSTFSAGAPS